MRRWWLVLLSLSPIACSAPVPSGDESTTAANTGTGESGAGDESSSSGETGGSADTGTDTGDTTSSFAPPVDTPPDPVECDPWEPECGDGQKCTAYATKGSSWDANKCVDVMGDKAPGEPCVGFGENAGVSGLDDCAEGSMCWGIDADTGVGYCIAFCAGSPDDPACADGTLCAIYNNGVLPLCLFECDPVAPECPNPDNICISDPGGKGFVCVLDGSGGMGGYGSDCTFTSSCNQGLFCATKEAVPGCVTAGCCSEYCDITEPNTCAGKDGGQVCVPWFEEGQAPEGYENVGGCAIPP